ncbi:hypothetical protein [Achromobacter marplatensis]|nr:hypothetical protein [Achromobacter marplatensis]
MSGQFEMVRNGNWDAALNVASDPFGLLGDMTSLKQDLNQLTNMRAERQIEAWRTAMADAGMKSVPSYSDALVAGPDGVGRTVRDYVATAENLRQAYEGFVRDNRLKEMWGNNYASLRIGKSQMTPLEFEKRVLDIQQRSVDGSYERGTELLASGELRAKPNERSLKLGIFIDDRVRAALRNFAKSEGLVDNSASMIWAVNRRLKDDSSSVYGIPDNRIGASLYSDTTVALKGAYSPQIQNWYSIRPGNILIIRPSVMPGPVSGSTGSYAVPRPALESYRPIRNGKGM